MHTTNRMANAGPNTSSGYEGEEWIQHTPTQQAYTSGTSTSQHEHEHEPPK